MKATPKTGTTGTRAYRVESRHAIDFADDQLPAVLATPFLIGFLERTARETLDPFLEPHETSVGVEIELEHFGPTAVGDEVTCTARVVHAEGRRISLQIEARDARETVARGFHKRHVIIKERFARHLARKQASSP